MACYNCGNGCTDIISDKCVKYTGVDVAALGIKNGDYLCTVEEQLINFLLSALDGTGIVLDVDTVCSLISDNIPEGGELTLPNIITALIASICSLQEQLTALSEDVTGLSETLSAIEANYTIGCLEGVATDSGTHAILQAVITALCALKTELETNYVAGGTDLDAYIANYLENNPAPVSSLMKNRMVPYTVVEYYGSLSYFDSTGAGTGDWVDVYLCNGQNGTPDKRGRIPVGAIVGVPGSIVLDTEVNPVSSPFNTNYALSEKAGANSVTLSTAQLPSHTHNSSGEVTIPPHTHFVASLGNSTALTPTTPVRYRGDWSSAGEAYLLTGANAVATEGLTSPTEEDVITVSMANPSVGNNDAHSNVPPVLACYYIMYRPS